MLAKLIKFISLATPITFVLGGSIYGVSYPYMHHNTLNQEAYVGGWVSRQITPRVGEVAINPLESSFTIKVGQRAYIALPPNCLLISNDPKVLKTTLPKLLANATVAPEVIALKSGTTYLGVLDSDITIHQYIVTITR